MPLLQLAIMHLMFSVLWQANSCEVIYVPGNHDETVRTFLTR